MKLLGEKIKTIEASIKKEKPLIHHITNYVTSSDCANITLCFGGSPIMAEDLEEIKEIVEAADALILNLGVINKGKFAAMLVAAKIAKMRGIPIILDPVGVMASSMRLKMAQELIKSGVQIIRCNYAEGRALLGDINYGQGVDAGIVCDSKGIFARQAAKTFNCVVAVTGEVDAISDGRRVVLGRNGNELLGEITGAGCMTTSLVACGAAVSDDYFLTTVLGITAMNVAAEQAKESLAPHESAGTFRVRLFDAISTMDGTTIVEGFKGEIL